MSDEVTCPRCGKLESGAHACRKPPSLTELLKSVEPPCTNVYGNTVLLEDYDRMKQVALILAEAIADIRKYSLGSKADTCDEATQKAMEILNGREK